MKKKVVAVSSKEVKKRSIIKQYDIFFVLSLRQNRKKEMITITKNDKTVND